MKKNLIAILMVVMSIGIGRTQLPSSFPPKSCPASIMSVSDPKIAEYWDIKKILYIGLKDGEHWFLVMGEGKADHCDTYIEIFYICDDYTLQSAGPGWIEGSKRGKAFQFNLTVGTSYYDPKSFLGFLFRDERVGGRDKVPELPEFINLNKGLEE